ncbi:MAG: hypothetical protein ACXQTS_00980 [Candidatus Methanospirareceae archaeon]
MGILWEEKEEIPIGEDMWYEIIKYYDSGCCAGCGLNMEIYICKRRPITEEERREEIESLEKGIEKNRRVIEELKEIKGKILPEGQKPNFKELQRRVSSTRKGTLEHEEALKKLKEAHKRWSEVKGIGKEIRHRQKTIEGMERRMERLKRGEGVFKVEREFLLGRCFFWEEAEEDFVKDFINRFVYDREFRSRSIKEEEAWCHLNTIYSAAERELYDMFSEYPHFIGYTVGDKKAEREHKRLYNRFMELCESLYYYIRRHLNELVESDEYREAVEKGRMENFAQDLIRRFLKDKPLL